jgi:hypothetical protein
LAENEKSQIVTWARPLASATISGVDAAPSVGGMVTSRHGGRWVEHRWLAFGLRAAVLVLPATGALAASFLASRAVARPSDWAGRALWWTGMLALSTAVLVVVDRQARRLIPLAVLLSLRLNPAHHFRQPF